MAFTLLELLVAMTLLAILSVLMFSAVQEASAIWESGSGRMNSRKDGRDILNNISRELAIAALPADRNDTNGLQLVINPSSLSSTKFANPQAIFWQVPTTSTSSNGSMAEVGYLVRWDTNKPGNPRAMLCRFFVNPNATSNYKIFSDPDNWINDAEIAAVAPGLKDSLNPTNSYRGWFADNVIALWVRCLDPSGNPITQNMGGDSINYHYDSRKGYRYTPTNSPTPILQSGYVQNGTNYVLATLPPSIEVAIVTLDPKAAPLLAEKPAYNSASPLTFWQDIDTFVSNLPAPVRKGTRVYSTRVILQNSN